MFSPDRQVYLLFLAIHHEMKFRSPGKLDGREKGTGGGEGRGIEKERQVGRKRWETGGERRKEGEKRGKTQQARGSAACILDMIYDFPPLSLLLPSPPSLLTDFASTDSPFRGRNCITATWDKLLCSWQRLVALPIFLLPLIMLVAIEIVFQIKKR